jgi:SAM-dependent methyltransferase
MFAPYVRGKVLEWGCQHGLDSCVFRMRFGRSVQLFSCDVFEDSVFKPFHEFSGTAYSRIRHPFKLDYSDSYFDVVLSNGVLEHVPDDLASIKEVHRILKPGGVFIVTCLPNRWSYTEAMARFLKASHHDRLYTIGSGSKMLGCSGFEVVRTKHFFMVPTMLGPLTPPIKKLYQRVEGLVWLVNDLLERVQLVNRLSSNLMLIARKV